MAAAGVPFTLLDGSDVRRRWPAITVADDVVAAHQADTGLVSPDRAVPLLQRLATSAGADLRGEVLVRELTAGDGFVEVVVEGADRPLRPAPPSSPRTPGPTRSWPASTSAPLHGAAGAGDVLRRGRSGALRDGRLPVWIWMDEPSFYGFPSFGRPGVKIAQDCGGGEVTADDRGYEPDPAILERTDAFGRSFFGGGWARPSTRRRASTR